MTSGPSDDNPLTDPASNLPGVKTEDANDLHATYQQEYYEPGGKRTKGENRKTDYDERGLQNPSPETP